MLEFLDKGNLNWLLKKPKIASSYCMEAEEGSRKRKGQEILANDEVVKRSESQNFTHTSFDQKVNIFLGRINILRFCANNFFCHTYI